jgi:iron complex transport system ATP-binding protein
MSRLHIQALTLRRGTRTVLDAIDLSLDSGGVTAVLGRNGAGKSTLLSCIAGLLPPSSGTISLDGEIIATTSTGKHHNVMPARQRARHIAFLPQTPEILWPIDVQTLVQLGRIPFEGMASDASNEAAVTRAMQLTEVAQWSTRMVTTLSGGERARVQLARVIAGESNWILADEPFAGLDPAHQFEAADLLRNCAARGAGVILTIHDLALAARIADRIVVLDQGRVVADGAPAVALSVELLRDVYGIDAQWFAAGGERQQASIAIHGKYVD